MNTQNITFTNRTGERLAARIDLPLDQHPEHFALFAHCFTCSKNISAVKNISRALTQKGIGVLRFDFTGLGNSEGSFEETTFSHNVSDLLDAAEYLSQLHKPPTILIGHSLGGAAGYFAGNELDTVKAIVSIGAPSEPEHVKHLVQDAEEKIKESGAAEVFIGGRPFTIKKDFLDDLSRNKLKDILPSMRKSVMIMHSPQDETVEISNAKELYTAAHHPKSFVTLDGADHLLSDASDSLYVGDVIATWAARYLPSSPKENLKSKHDVVGRLGQEKYTTQLQVGPHRFLADEPKDVGGQDFGPSPYDFVSAGLTACTAMTLRMYADIKKWPLDEIFVHVDHHKSHADDCKEIEENAKKVDHFDRFIELKGDLDEKQRNRLLQIANKCPVHKTLHEEVIVRTVLKEE